MKVKVIALLDPIRIEMFSLGTKQHSVGVCACTYILRDQDKGKAVFCGLCRQGTDTEGRRKSC